MNQNPAFLNGQELSIENGLPLGLSASTTYAESPIWIGNDEQLTLLTDGVVEARSRTGELFGFERTAAIAKSSAESIARAALEFGQEPSDSQKTGETAGDAAVSPGVEIDQDQKITRSCTSP